MAIQEQDRRSFEEVVSSAVAVLFPRLPALERWSAQLNPETAFTEGTDAQREFLTRCEVYGLAKARKGKIAVSEIPLKDNTLPAIMLRTDSREYHFAAGEADSAYLRQLLSADWSEFSPVIGAGVLGVPMGSQRAINGRLSRRDFLKGAVGTSAAAAALAGSNSLHSAQAESFNYKYGQLSKTACAALECLTGLELGVVKPSESPISVPTSNGDVTVEKDQDGGVIITAGDDQNHDIPESPNKPKIVRIYMPLIERNYTPPPLIEEGAMHFTEGIKAGQVDYDLMYRFVGDYNHAKRHHLDYRFDTVNVAYWVANDLKTVPDHSAERERIKADINGNEGFRDYLRQARSAIANQFVGQDSYDDFTIIVDSNRVVSQVIRNVDDELIRYVYENGSLRLLTREEEPMLMAPLSSPDKRLIRTDTGVQVMLRGATMLHFQWHPNAEPQRDFVERDLKALKEMGGNYVVINWNSGLIDNPIYITRLIEAIKLAKLKYGLRVHLDLASRGFIDSSDPPTDLYAYKHIETLDDQVLQDWERLLNKPEVAFWLGKTVDMYNIVSEPVYNAQGENHPSFFDQINTDTSEAIRTAIGNPNAICSRSGGRWGWAGDADELLGHERTWLENTVNVHPYKYPFGQEPLPEPIRSDIRNYAQDLQLLGHNITVGECGWRDWENGGTYMQDILNFFEQNKITYSLWGLLGGYQEGTPEVGDRGFLLRWAPKDTINYSPVGEYVKNFWSQYQED